MELLHHAEEILLGIVMFVLAVCLLASLFRSIFGPRFTDRIVGINMIGTQTILIICILAYLIGEQYLVDIALIYAMISFLAVVVMVNIYLSVYREKALRSKAEAELMRAEHDIEVGNVKQETASSDASDSDEEEV